MHINYIPLEPDECKLEYVKPGEVFKLKDCQDIHKALWMRVTIFSPEKSDHLLIYRGDAVDILAINIYSGEFGAFPPYLQIIKPYGDIVLRERDSSYE